MRKGAFSFREDKASLYISGTELGLAGATALSDYVLNDDLTYLDLTNTNITDEGCRAILHKIEACNYMLKR